LLHPLGEHGCQHTPSLTTPVRGVPFPPTAPFPVLSQRRFLVVLMSSVAAHLLLLWQLPAPKPPLSTTGTGSAMSIELTEAPTAAAQPSDASEPALTPHRQGLEQKPAGTGVMRESLRKLQQSAAATAAPQHTEKPSSGVPRHLDLSPALLRRAARDAAALDPSAAAEPGGTVFDPRLRERLVEAGAGRVNPPGSAGGAGESPHISFGGETRFFEVDGLCFQVRDRDPLTSTTLDTWYRVPCPKSTTPSGPLH
jgi:hypothetical protein